MKKLTLAIQADEHETQANLADDRGCNSGIIRYPNQQASSTVELIKQTYLRARSEYGGFLDSDELDKTAIVALPGLESPSLHQAALATTQKALGEEWSIWLCDSLAPKLVGALGGKPGLLAHSDTDASVACLDHQGKFFTKQHEADSLGREGSGLWLGTRLLQVAARMTEGKLEHSSKLEEALKNHFSVQTLTQLFHELEEKFPTPESMTQLGLLTVNLAEFPHPDPACRALVTRTSRRLAELVKDCIFESEVRRATWTGRILGGTFLEEVQKEVSELSWQAAAESWVEGAHLMAQAVRSLSDTTLEPQELWLRVTEMSPEHS